jgi:ribonuclease J
MAGKIEIIPLGGIGEFGMNAMGIRYVPETGDAEMILADIGMGFPEETPYGVDVAVPNLDFLEDYRDELHAVILTHGHEDHLGALPYLLKKFNLPVYASRFTLGLAERKLEEHGLMDDILLHRVKANDRVTLGFFTVEFIHASHSLIDCFSLAIKTPVGTLIHTGDYKIDDKPVIGKPYDLETLGKYGDEGVLALLSDSTNATVPGRTPSESDVIPALEDIFGQAPGRLIVTTFSSSIHRLQVVLDLAASYDRKVCVLGRSMLRNVEIASDMGFLRAREGLLIDLSEARQLDGDEIVYLVTGSQAETRAVMMQMATQGYKGLVVEPGDTVVISARIIPGNERGISKMIGHIYKSGGNIIEEKRRQVHVSGHASQEDIRIMTETVRPKFVVPIHGEYRMLFRHKEFVKNHLGYAEENVILIENGDVLELTANTARVIDRIEMKRVFIDESGFEEIALETVRERKKLAYDGVVSLVVTLDSKTKDLLADPIILMQGVAGLDPLNGLVTQARETVREAVSKLTRADINDTAGLKETLRIALKRFIQKETGTKPVIIPTIVEV